MKYSHTDITNKPISKFWTRFFICGIVCIVIIGLIIFLENRFVPPGEDRKRISNDISKEYGGYEIKNIELTYVDWFWSTSNDAEKDNHNATEAEITIATDSEQITIRLKKILNLFWVKEQVAPDYGPNTPEGVYFAEPYASYDDQILYKTEDGYVFEYSLKKPGWKKSDKHYSDLEYYSNYTKITKEKAEEFIKKGKVNLDE